MDIGNVGDQVKTSITSGWEKIAAGYHSLIVPPVRIIFDKISPTTGPVGAHVVLGGAAAGLFYLGYRIWHMKFEEVGNRPDGTPTLTVRGPKSRTMQIAFRILGLAAIFSSALIVGCQVAIGGGGAALSLGVTSAIALAGWII